MPVGLWRSRGSDRGYRQIIQPAVTIVGEMWFRQHDETRSWGCEMGTGAESSNSDTLGLTLGRTNAAAVATLHWPDRRNAISQAMQAALSGWFRRSARDPGIYAVSVGSALDGVFSEGGEVLDLAELGRTDLAAARAALASEGSLCWQIECFTKPTVSLIDGIVSGTGVGLTLYGTHRVASEGYRLSTPEAAIGLVPRCGIAHAFARMPDGIGVYLGLTGADVGPADALALRLATHVIPRSEHGAILSLLADADPVDPVLDARHREPEEGPLFKSAARIARYFHAPSLVDVLARLEKPHAEDREWAAETATVLRSRSPLALALTFRAISNAAGLDIRETLIQDFRLASRLIGDPDFQEGVRATRVDADTPPRWQHRRVEDVPHTLVEAYLAPLGEEDLALPSRGEMEAAR
jgi:enoyl-CoA hydratase